MKKILMISTGGTISSSKEEGSLQPKLSGEELINFVPELSGICDISFIEPMCLDSTNVQPEDWVTIGRIVDENMSLFDGFVITHGTDTMAYTAAALSYILKDVKKPVVLTGSQLPMTDPFTDAKRNILDAFSTAIMEYYPGVYITFGGIIINGRCATKIDTQDLNAFASINEKQAGIVTGDNLVHFFNPVPESDKPYIFCPDLDTKVLLIKLYPGFSPDMLMNIVFGDSGNPIPRYHGVILEAFGAGGIPFTNRNLLPVIRKLFTHNIVICCKTQCPYGASDMSIYKVGVDALKAGAINLKGLTSEAALAKLMWGLGNYIDFDHVCNFMRN